MTGYSVKEPLESIRPSTVPRFSINHIAPPGPSWIYPGEEFSVGSGKSVMVPSGLMRETALPMPRVNQVVPPGPAATP